MVARLHALRDTQSEERGSVQEKRISGLGLLTALQRTAETILQRHLQERAKALAASLLRDMMERPGMAHDGRAVTRLLPLHG